MTTARTGAGRARTGRLLATTVAVAVGVAGGLSAGTPARAGSNGQQVYFDWGPAWGRATLEGTNNNGQYVTSPSIYLGATGYGALNDWWWKGWVTVHFYYADGASRDSRTCWVPTEQSGSDWTSCF
ncbi:hypothetical protein [Micromonospora antibiotica]|uniref:Secreted protein n=1 Tax=Micromonospora antibiotica TaxID=2807623 RepID=A0ABS3V649_9ACTN|nr:hypothetical protein [Micromonospora antibiotica]MBO4161056.1 hypothetical protein [Micromonospora antibiotica]